MTLSSSLIRSTVVAALGGLLFGFDTAVIAGTTSALTHTWHLSPGGAWASRWPARWWAPSSGAMLAGIPGDRMGRRDSLRLMAVLYLVSALGCAFAWDWYSLVFFRFIGGLGIGGSSVLGPMYIAEIAPAKWRGRLVGLFQFNVVAGILLAYLSNYLVGLQSFGDAEWRWKLGVSAVPAALFFVMLVRHSAQPALAGAKGPRGRSPQGAGQPSAKRTSSRNFRTWSRRSIWSTAAGRSRSSRRSTAFRFSWPSPSPCSTSSPASTRSCIT